MTWLCFASLRRGATVWRCIFSIQIHFLRFRTPCPCPCPPGSGTRSRPASRHSAQSPFRSSLFVRGSHLPQLQPQIYMLRTCDFSVMGAAYQQAHTGGTRGSLTPGYDTLLVLLLVSLKSVEAGSRGTQPASQGAPETKRCCSSCCCRRGGGGGGGVGGCKPGSDTAGHSANCQIPSSLPPNRPPHSVPKSAAVLQHQRDRTTGITGNARTCFPVDLQPPFFLPWNPFPSPPRRQWLAAIFVSKNPTSVFRHSSYS